MKKCPFCFEEIQSQAVKCKHCGEWLDNEQEKPIKGEVEISTTNEKQTKHETEIPSQIEEQAVPIHRKISKGYLGLLVLFIFYANMMMRKPFLENDVTRYSWPICKLLELAGIVLLFYAHLKIRKWLVQKKWFSTNVWIASLISGVASFLVIANAILIIQVILYG